MLKIAVGFLSLFIVAQSQASQYRLSHVACGNPMGPTGPVGVTFSGAFAGDGYFNITLVNPWGMPFPQQAKIVSMDVKSDVLSFDLLTMVTNQQVKLTLFSNTTRGVMKIQRGEPIELTCTSRIEAL